MTLDNLLMVIFCYFTDLRVKRKHFRLLKVGSVKVLTPARHACLETVKFEYIYLVYHRLENSGASRSPVVSLFILRLGDKIFAPRGFCYYYKYFLRNTETLLSEEHHNLNLLV